MSFISTPLIPPSIISNDVAGETGNAQTAAANTVYLWAFEISMPIIITAMRWRSTTTATGNVNMGVYTLAGNLVAGSDTGAVVNHAANTLVTSTYGTALKLAPGAYHLAFACDAADTFQGVSPTITNNSRGRKATNALAAGALPSTTGTQVSAGILPAVAAIISGGLN